MGKVVHGAMCNCMIVPYDDPDGWYFKQFVSQGQIEDFARMHNLIMKVQDGTQGS